MVLGNLFRISTLVISVSVFAANAVLIPYAQAREEGDRSARMEKDLNELFDQSAAAIQTMLDQKTFEVKNSEKLFMARLERGMDRIGDEIANASPEALAVLHSKFAGTDIGDVTQQELAADFADQKTETRLAVARELAQIRESNPSANSVTQFLRNTQQKILNRGITLPIGMVIFLVVAGGGFFLGLYVSAIVAGIWVVGWLIFVKYYYFHNEAKYTTHLDHSISNLAETSEPILQVGRLDGASPEVQDFIKGYKTIEAQVDQQVAIFDRYSADEAIRKKSLFLQIAGDLREQYEALTANVKKRKWYHRFNNPADLESAMIEALASVDVFKEKVAAVGTK